jgi:hypothetical protein
MDKVNITDLGVIVEQFGKNIEKLEAELAEQEAKRQRLERFTGFFSRVNSAFTFRPVKVTVEHAGIKAPAWSTSDTVTFNSNEIGDLDSAESIAGIKGLDLHEISHILYTPREASDITTWVIDNKLWTAFNALEDQRIESLFTSKYPSTIAWFTATILIHFKNEPEVFKQSYPLLCGRKYLPVEIRKEARDLYPYQDRVDDFRSIVDQYRTLVFPADTEKGKTLIKQYHDLLPQSEGEGEGQGEGKAKKYKAVKEGTEGAIPVAVIDPFGHGRRPVEGLESSTSRPVPPRQQEKERDRMVGRENPITINADDVDWSDFENDEEPETPAPAPEARDEVTPNGGAGDSEVTSEGDAESDDEGEGKPSNTAGSDAGELIATTLGEILAESAIADEINEIIRVISGKPLLETNNSETPSRLKYNEISPDSVTVDASRSFGRELERLRIEHEPNWDRFENSGRLNAGRYIQGESFETIFDQWNEGREDATDIECVIAIDNSGSMSGSKIANANRAMYAIKRALDRIQASTTVLTFSDQAHVLYDSKEQANSMIRDGFSGGGTTPTDAIAYATKLLAESERKIKVFFVITDGEWYSHDNNKSNHEAIEKLSHAGVLTAFAYIPDSLNDGFVLNYESAHHCEIGGVVSNPFDLVTMARAIVKYAISRRLVNA